MSKKPRDIEVEAELDEDEGGEGSHGSSSAKMNTLFGEKGNVAGLEHPSYEELEEKLTDMEAREHEAHDKLLRLQAELDNFRRRAEQDVAKAHKFALTKFVEDLLPVVDSLENGLQHGDVDSETVKSMHEGMEMTLTILLSALKKYGVEPLNPEGEIFNPEFHEAMTMQEGTGAEANTIITVFQKGYLLNGRLIRPARVIVAK